MLGFDRGCDVVFLPVLGGEVEEGFDCCEGLQR